MRTYRASLSHIRAYFSTPLSQWSRFAARVLCEDVTSAVKNYDPKAGDSSGFRVRSVRALSLLLPEGIPDERCAGDIGIDLSSECGYTWSMHTLAGEI